MRHTLALLGLTGALMFTAMSASERAALFSSYAWDDLAPALAGLAPRVDARLAHELRAAFPDDRPEQAARSEQASLTDQAILPDNEGSAAPAEARAKSSLERARAALEESNAPALSNKEICTQLVAVAQA